MPAATETDHRRAWPSSLFWFALAARGAGGYGFATAGSEQPGFALSSNLIYRSEIGLAFLATIY